MKFHSYFAKHLIKDNSSLEQNDDSKITEEHKEWKALLETIINSENTNDCVYLADMKNAMLNYTEIVYPQKWKNKFNQILPTIEVGIITKGYFNVRKFRV